MQSAKTTEAQSIRLLLFHRHFSLAPDQVILWKRASETDRNWVPAAPDSAPPPP